MLHKDSPDWEHLIKSRALFRPDCPECMVIAEVAQAHDGSLGQAHAFIDAVARAGASAVKFQTHIADAESTSDEPFRISFSHQDANRYEYWKRMEFSPEQWCGLQKHARERGLVFLSSPFSVRAVELLDRLEVPLWKVGSGDTGNLELLSALVQTRRPVLISTGMSTFLEIDATAQLLREKGVAYAIMQCTSRYPTPAEQTGLNLLAEFRERYQCAVGLSDHSGTIYPSLAARVLGASFVEVHVTFSREMFGPDTSSSVEMPELSHLVRGIEFLGKALNNPVSKDSIAKAFEEQKRIFGRSIVPLRDLEAGDVLSASDIGAKKPGGGLDPKLISMIVGKSVRRGLRKDEHFSLEDIE